MKYLSEKFTQKQVFLRVLKTSIYRIIDAVYFPQIMNVIGIRSTPGIIYYSVISFGRGKFFTFVNDKIIIPKSFDLPQKLKYIRQTLLDIFNEYAIVHAGIRTTEPSAYNGADTTRVMIEGVIQEMLASSTIMSYFTGVKSSIAAKLGIPPGSISDVMDGRVIFNEITDWGDIRLEHREAIMVGFASKK